MSCALNDFHILVHQVKYNIILLMKDHTHTHTHTYIYIYIWVKNVGVFFRILIKDWIL
jgi:hypothetical protein